MGYHVQIQDCDGCGQVYAEGTNASYRTTGRACRDFAWTNVSLANTQALGSCIDVYAAVGSDMDGNVSAGFHSIRVCRCNRQNGTCVRCSSSGCDAM